MGVHAANAQHGRLHLQLRKSSQVFCLGVIAQRLNADLFFDTRNKVFTNNEFANAMLAGLPPRKGWDEFYKL